VRAAGSESSLNVGREDPHWLEPSRKFDGIFKAIGFLTYDETTEECSQTACTGAAITAPTDPRHCRFILAGRFHVGKAGKRKKWRERETA